MIHILKARVADGGRLLPTLLIGACGSGLAYAVRMPLPWLLGALIVTTALSLAGVRLPSPTASRKAVLAVIGVMLGAAFTPDMAGDIGRWGASLAIMLVSTAVMMVVSVWMSRRIAGNSLDTAIYAGMPGGLSAVTLMAADSEADLRAVGLAHAVRVLVLLLAIPPVLQLIGHVNLQARNVTLSQWLAMPAWGDALMLVGAGIAGAWLGRLQRLPNPLLFGPVLVSGLLHVTGICEATIPPVVVAFAQIVIGVSVGVRFVGTPLASLGVGLLISVIQALLLMLIAVAAAWLGHAVTGYSPAAALLAYMPGGAPELSLVALSLGIEPAFVTSHHLLRLTVLILLMPLLLSFLKRRFPQG
ncbi:AbrB family transcriptional regulator [Marinobacter halodurans]|uniref:AbrB family transcriptional regulator n=1 Tax=Marinobacter halodurans TaxID=2528979 RepID=A0ABY1ZHP1_9GAMM|nr:AbrB family transcriptional regulator [Marinobacter halodurans]TBW53313.1 AbrB family transcriptional regulator [Marinobacter halodurans]